MAKINGFLKSIHLEGPIIGREPLNQLQQNVCFAKMDLSSTFQLIVILEESSQQVEQKRIEAISNFSYCNFFFYNKSAAEMNQEYKQTLLTRCWISVSGKQCCHKMVMKQVGKVGNIEIVFQLVSCENNVIFRPLTARQLKD